MKNSSLLLLTALLLLAGCGKKNSPVIISGTVNGAAGNELYYSIPLKGTSFPYFQDTLFLDPSGGFILETETDAPVFITFRLPETSIPKGEYTYREMTLPVMPGQSLTLTIDREEGAASFVAQGEYVEVVNAYMGLPVPPYFYNFGRIFHHLPPQEIVDTTAILKEEDMKPFRRMKENRTIPAEMYRLIAADRDCYYALAATYAYMGQVRDFTLPDSLRSVWLDIYRQYPPDENTRIASPSWPDYAYFFINSLPYFTEGFTRETLQNLHREGRIHTFFLEQARERLSGQRLEYYTAFYLFQEGFQKNYEKELIGLYDRFTEEYPRSPYIPFIEKEIEEIRLYHEKISGPVKETIRILDDQENISSLSEALAPFKGKKVYIDVWATWCGPCKREFAFKEPFHQWLTEHGYELLYISIDEESAENKWLEMMRYYDLEGYHIRASEALEADLYRIYDQNGTLMIPWYMEIDKEGNIRERHARKPSEIIAADQGE